MPAPGPRDPLLVPVLLVSIAAWTLLLAEGRGLAVPDFCAMTIAGPSAALASLDLALALNPPAPLLAGWALMLAAMMSPLLLTPLRHLHQRSLPRRRGRAIALFVAGYALIWMAAGAVLLALALLLRLILPWPWLTAGFAVLAAIVWQASPARQRCLNRRHRRPALAAFGLEADLDAAVFGLSHGAWCVAACWALMLLPLVVPTGHLPAMAAVALWLVSEHLEPPVAPRWAWRWPLTPFRMVIARTRLSRLSPSSPSTPGR